MNILSVYGLWADSEILETSVHKIYTNYNTYLYIGMDYKYPTNISILR